MNRINVFYYDPIDGEVELAGWFDADKALRWEEGREWDGNNYVGAVSRQKHGGQDLYRTAKGRWVLHTWSNWQGSKGRWEFIPDQAARDWLVQAGHEKDAEEHLGVLEDERGPGRPEVGPRVAVRLPEEVVEQLDQAAAKDGVSRAELIRQYVANGLANRRS